jgi:hypothetical protein
MVAMSVLLGLVAEIMSALGPPSLGGDTAIVDTTRT